MLFVFEFCPRGLVREESAVFPKQNTNTNSKQLREEKKNWSASVIGEGRNHVIPRDIMSCQAAKDMPIQSTPCLQANLMSSRSWRSSVDPHVASTTGGSARKKQGFLTIYIYILYMYTIYITKQYK